MRLDCHVGDIDIAARGKFFQTAEGRKTRLEIIFEDAGTPLSLLQICDSQFSYTLRSTGNQQRLEFVALDRLENMDARLTDATTPASWVMGGGMGATLIYYAEAFHFQSVETSATGRIHVRGIWDSDALAMLLYSHLPVQDRPQEIAWDAVPTQIPHGIELSFVKGPDDLLQPEKISFFRFVREQGRAVAMPMLSINFEPLNTSLELPPALFQIETGGLEAMEMTDVYNQKIRAMLVGQPKIAHDPINSGQRR